MLTRCETGLKMNVLITGAAGFIGSNLLHYLLQARPNWNITALDALTYAGNLENLAQPLKEKSIQFVKIDICNKEDIDNLFTKSKFELVFHLAAESHVDRSIHSANNFVLTNVLGTQNLLDAARNQGVRRFVHISTDEVYGSLGPSGRFVETTPLDPTSPYAASKAASDLMVLACYKTHKFDCIVTRCTNNYGPYQFPEKLIPLFISNALDNIALPLYGDGMNVRSWIYVMDHCEALLLVAEKGQGGQVYNIGGDESSELPNSEVTKIILKVLSKPETLVKMVADRPAHDRRYAVDSSKIKSNLAWQSRTTFDQGIKKTVQWYVENRAWWERIKTGAYLEFYSKNYDNR